MPRRKGFNINTWRPMCKCKHMHTEHKPTRPHKCTACGCFDFQSDFCCISCEKKFEDHITIYELENERRDMKKPIREAFLPLANNPEVQKATMEKIGLD